MEEKTFRIDEDRFDTMSPGAESSTEELQQMLERLERYQKATGSLSPYYRSLIDWTKNVDKRYAWVVLTALWFMMAATLGPYRIYSLIFAKVTADEIFTREEASWPVSMIFTMENCAGPIVSILIYYMSHRKSLFLGSLFLTAGNGFSFLSRSLVLDVALIGVVQGIGYAFIFMPFLEIINSYFLRYRNLAFGIALTGGTASVFVWTPIFQWLLDNYQWRASYLGICIVTCINLIMVPLLKPNPRPKVVKPISHELSKRQDPIRKISQMSQLSFRALQYRNSVRSQSSIIISRRTSKVGHSVQRQPSVISVNPFANTVGLERKISRAISNEFRPELRSSDKGNLAKAIPPAQIRRISSTDDCYESVSLSEVHNELGEDDFSIQMIWDVLKTPGFHLIWYNELIYFWIFSIYSLILVDYGVDRGCSTDEAESLINFQSVGELLGRIVLTYVVDLRLVSNKTVVVIVLLTIAGLLVLVTQVSGFIWMAGVTTILSSVIPLLYILLNVLLVDCLGEQRVTLGYGMASCVGGILMSFRPRAVGYFKDELKSYESLLFCLSISCVFGALLWVLEPIITKFFRRTEQTSPPSPMSLPESDRFSATRHAENPELSGNREAGTPKSCESV